ncbi:hypothetical protein B0G62_1161, partial [Paraburkholderia eburnea]
MQKAVPWDGFLFALFLALARTMCAIHAPKRQNPGSHWERPGFWTHCIRSLTITYFH